MGIKGLTARQQVWKANKNDIALNNYYSLLTQSQTTLVFNAKQHRRCKQKLVRLLFDFGIIPEVTSMQQMITVKTRWELTTSANFHRLLMSTGCKSSHRGFPHVNRSIGGLRISRWICQLSCLTIFSISLSFIGLAVGENWKLWKRCGTHGTRNEKWVQLHIDQTCEPSMTQTLQSTENSWQQSCLVENSQRLMPRWTYKRIFITWQSPKCASGLDTNARQN